MTVGQTVAGPALDLIQTGAFGVRDYDLPGCPRMYTAVCGICAVEHVIPSQTIVCEDAVRSFQRGGWQIEEGRIRCSDHAVSQQP